MLQLRPTFSESWYRVVNLKPRLRGTAQISRQYYRGERWYVVRDPAGNQFHRLSDAAYKFVGLLDGRRTVGEAWELVGGQLDDDAPTQPEVIQILSQLFSANLVETDISPDASVLLRRHKKQMQRKMQGRLMNVLFPRIPIWDPNRFITRWMPVARLALSKYGAALWIIVVGLAILKLAPLWPDLQQAAKDSIDPKNWFYLWVTFVLIKFIHELGHAFSCRRFGGEVHEMGIMFLVFVPTPYVDASTAWAFPSKWARMFVGAAGMWVELFFAAIMAFVWVATHGSHGLIPQLAYNAMLIASVTTVIFNANPLLRYDGYYMLSDFLEIPNLQQKSQEYLLGLIKRHVFRVKSQQPLPPVGQRIQLFVYAILSGIYRVFVGIAIIAMVAFKVPVLGMLMAVGGIATWAIVPVGKLGKYLALDPELHRKRGPAIAFTVAMAALLAILIGRVPMPVNVDADGIVEPAQKYVLNVLTPGFVTEIHAKDGQTLKKGDVILVCQDDQLDAEIVEQESKIRAVEAKRQASSINDQAQMRIDDEELKLLRGQLADYQRHKAEQTILAPIDGKLVAPKLRDDQGRWLNRGEEVAQVIQASNLVVYAAIEQSQAELVFGQRDASTQIRLAGRPDSVLTAIPSKTILIEEASNTVRHASMTSAGPGDLPLDPQAAAAGANKNGVKIKDAAFELQATVANPQDIYLPGQSAKVVMKLSGAPIAEQATRWFLRLIQSRQLDTSNKLTT